MTYEIRIRKRGNKTITQDTYNVPQEIGRAIETILIQLIPKKEISQNTTQI